MSRALLLPLAVLVAGCTGDIGGPGSLTGNLEVAPNLSDVGTVAVGGDKTFTIDLTATTADVRVTRVSVLNVEGEYFTPLDFGVVAEEGADNPTDDDPSDVLIIERDTTRQIELSYAPLREGYHRALVQVSSDALDDEISVEVRGRGDTPDASVFPWVVDFGAAERFVDKIDFLFIQNESDLPLTLSQANFNDSEQFGTNEVLPLTLDPGEPYTLELFTNPKLQGPISTTLTLTVGEVPLQNITLRANNCADGTPADYDEDEDGVTTCGGDCDDSLDVVYPGAPELADLIDNDCDGVIDNGTPNADDDGDGFCDHPSFCADPLVLPGDCNDGDEFVNPDADEIPNNGIDDDCDGTVDAGTADFDQDGVTQFANPPDCEPYDPDVYPGAPEIPDNKDNDCNTFVDDTTVLFDDDGDGFCEGQPGGASVCSDGTDVGDCDDTDPNVRPGAVEVADWRDNDCDGSVDEGTGNYDDDGDGYTENANPSDCDDDDPNIGPSSLEIPGNGIDDDCDPSTPALSAE